MAKNISSPPPPRDPREELRARLEHAPLEHAEAVLSLYEVLQGMHDSGALEALRGALGAKDRIMEELAGLANTPESVRGIRNLIILAKALGSIDPGALQAVAGVVPDALSRIKAESPNPPSLWALLKAFQSPEARRGLAAAALTLEQLGKHMGSLQAPPSKTGGSSLV